MPHSPPDVIFHSGRITTLNKGQPVAQAVAVKDGNVLVCPLADEQRIKEYSAPKL